MKRKLLLLLAGFAWFSSQGQLVNDGATIVIQPGATLFVESNFQNVSGNLTNNGTMEVMGDFTNDAGSDVTGSGLIKFTGSGVSTVMLAGEPLNNVAVQKTGAGNVTLGSPMTINNTLTMTSGNIVLDEFDLTLASTVVTPISGAGASSYIHTNDPLNGQLIKSMSSAGMYTFPVGDDMFYSPVTATPTGASGSVSVAVENAAPSNLGTNPNYLTRNWKVNTTGFTSNILMGTYNELDDVVGTETLIKGATLTGMTWSFNGSSGNAGTNMIGATAPMGDVVFSGLTTLGTLKLKTWLAGSYYTVGDTMSSGLKWRNQLPPNSPYDNITPGTPPSNTTDWILLELSDPNNPANPIISKSAFILKDGNIVDNDGVGDPEIFGAYEPSIVTIRHRNHFAIRSRNPLSTQAPVMTSLIDTSLVNFPTNTSSFSMRLLEPGVWGMWGGNGVVDNVIKFGGSTNDRDPIKNHVLTFPGNTLNSTSYTVQNVYNTLDVNLDGTIKYSGTNNDSDIIKNIILTNPRNTLNSTSHTITSHF